MNDVYILLGFLGGTCGKELPADAVDVRESGLVPGLGRYPGGEQSNPLQYSCLENPLDRGTWLATVCRVAESQTRLKQLSEHIRFTKC